MRRGSSIELRIRSQKPALISMARSRAFGGRAARRARVVPPVPGPSSMASWALARSAVRVMRRSIQRELGMIDPTSLGFSMNPRRKAIGCCGRGISEGVSRWASDMESPRASAAILVVYAVDLPLPGPPIEAQATESAVARLDIVMIDGEVRRIRPPMARRAPGAGRDRDGPLADGASHEDGASGLEPDLGGLGRPEDAQAEARASH